MVELSFEHGQQCACHPLHILYERILLIFEFAHSHPLLLLLLLPPLPSTQHLAGHQSHGCCCWVCCWAGRWARLACQLAVWLSRCCGARKQHRRCLLLLPLPAALQLLCAGGCSPGLRTGKECLSPSSLTATFRGTCSERKTSNPDCLRATPFGKPWCFGRWARVPWTAAADAQREAAGLHLRPQGVCPEALLAPAMLLIHPKVRVRLLDLCTRLTRSSANQRRSRQSAATAAAVASASRCACCAFSASAVDAACAAAASALQSKVHLLWTKVSPAMCAPSKHSTQCRGITLRTLCILF